jgi:Na+/H+-dicarboxylate symporter
MTPALVRLATLSVVVSPKGAAGIPGGSVVITPALVRLATLSVVVLPKGAAGTPGGSVVR